MIGRTAAVAASEVADPEQDLLTLQWNTMAETASWKNVKP